MKKLLKLSTILTLTFFCFYNTAFSQDFIKKMELQEDVSFDQLQREFYNWSKTVDLNKTKGWKYYKRWEDFNAKRADAQGFLPNPKTYFESYEKMQVQETVSKTYSWTPVGLMNEALIYDDNKETGIGRINCISFHPTDSNIFWVGVAQGGVWKTVDHGYSYTPLTDNLPMLRISDICVDPNDVETIYVSVCDYAYIGAGLLLDDRKRNTHYGLGVYKTTNGGDSWEPTGLSFAQTDYDGSLTRRVFIDENDSNELLAAGTHGIWKSSDGGDSWTQISDKLIWDIERDPNNPSTIYASTGYVHKLNLGECGIIKSTNFGDSWVDLETGLPETGEAQRVELAVSTTDPNYIYAIVCNINGGLYGFYSSTNAGETWSLKSTEPNVLEWYDGTYYPDRGQGGYDLAIIIDPEDNNRVFVGGINMWGTEDGGETWNPVSYWLNYYGPSLHADQHFFAHNSLDNNFYVCNDGGLYRTKDVLYGSWDDAYSQNDYQWPTHWERLNNGLMVTSFYRLGLSKNNVDYVIGGTQDNSTFYNNTNNWYNIFGGDGFECIIHPDYPEVIYGSSQYGNLYKSTNGGVDYNYISNDIDEDGEWTTPFVMDPAEPTTLYAGYGNVYKSTTSGNSWSPISNFQSVPGMGQPNLCSSVAVSKLDQDIIYAAKRFYHSFDEPASVHRTINGGDSWTNITSNLPDSIYYTYLILADENPDIAWITLAGFYEGHKVYKTEDGGASWANISRNLPNLPVNCIVEHQNADHNPVYIGMDVGIYYTNDTLDEWILYNNNMPNVIVSELEIHDATNKIYAATFGRGIWKTDLYSGPEVSVRNIIPVYKLNMSVQPNPVHQEFKIAFTNVDLNEAYLDIIDITGKSVYSKLLQFNNDKHFEKINADLSTGVYFATISHNKQTKSVKFVVK